MTENKTWLITGPGRTLERQLATNVVAPMIPSSTAGPIDVAAEGWMESPAPDDLMAEVA